VSNTASKVKVAPASSGLSIVTTTEFAAPVGWCSTRTALGAESVKAMM